MFPMSPEDFEKKQQEARERFVAARVETNAAIKDLLAGMTAEHLVILRRIMHVITADEDNGIRLAAFLEGQATALLVHVHDVCSGCGKDHTQEAIESILEDQIECVALEPDITEDED